MWKKFLRRGLTLCLLLAACSHVGGGKSVDPEALAFYRDEIDVTTLIREEDTPQRQAAMRLLAETLKNGRGEVSGEFENMLKIDGHNPYAYYFLAKSLEGQQRLDKALVMARRAEQLFAKDPPWQGKAIVLQAQVEKDLGRGDQARRLYEKARLLDPRNPLIDQGLRELAIPSATVH